MYYTLRRKYHLPHPGVDLERIVSKNISCPQNNAEYRQKPTREFFSAANAFNAVGIDIVQLLPKTTNKC